MPIKKRPEPLLQVVLDEIRSHGVILEDMRSQKRTTIEAVESTRLALEQRIDGLEQRIERLENDTRVRDAGLELALHELRVSVQQNTVDIRELNRRVEALARLEDRVFALERRLT